jgi:NO-binding membrane sensor protein with MHYT domain/methyl-accepting chemotaxis protein
MFQVFTCLTVQHDLRLVAVAGLVCFLASLSAVDLFHRAQHARGRARALWIATAGAATGCGIWATHFVAMLAYEPGIAVAYSVPMTVFSLLAAILVTSAGLSLAANFDSTPMAALGGGALGAGVACMHYTGMWALQVPGHVTWSLDLVIASVVLGMAFGMAALILAARHDGRGWTYLAAVLLTLAIVSHHFTAMGAVQIVPDPTRSVDALSMSPGWVALGVAATAVAILAVVLLGAFADRRLNEQRFQLGSALDSVDLGLSIFDADERLRICNKAYMRMYGISADVAKSGCHFLELLRHRAATGSFDQDPEEHYRTMRSRMAQGLSANNETRLQNGRIVSVSRHLIAGGGWVAVHEDVTERRADEEQRAIRAERESRRVAIEGAIAEFRARVDEVLHIVVTDAGTMKTTAEALLSSSAETTQSVESALQSSREASSSARSVVSAVGQLSSSINEIGRQLESTAELVNSAVLEAEDTNVEIARLAEVVQSIDEVVRFIQNIARQTNLLALNATIEAARAGAAGRGFSVVAAEVKALSVQTAKATDDVAKQIGAIQNSATQSVQAVGKITTRMQEIGGYASQAAACVRQQDGTTLDMSANAATAADGAKTVLSVLQGVSQDARDTSTSARTVLAASGRVQTSAAKLQEEVNGFLNKVAR